jgi:hypothetical protein
MTKNPERTAIGIIPKKGKVITIKPKYYKLNINGKAMSLINYIKENLIE